MSSQQRTVRGDISKYFLCFQKLRINKLQYVAEWKLNKWCFLLYVDYNSSIVSHYCLYAPVPEPPLAIISFLYILSPSEIHVRTQQLAVVFETYFKNVIYKVKDIALLQPLKESLTASRINLTI